MPRALALSRISPIFIPFGFTFVAGMLSSFHSSRGRDLYTRFLLSYSQRPDLVSSSINLEPKIIYTRYNLIEQFGPRGEKKCAQKCAFLTVKTAFLANFVDFLNLPGKTSAFVGNTTPRPLPFRSPLCPPLPHDPALTLVN